MKRCIVHWIIVISGFIFCLRPNPSSNSPWNMVDAPLLQAPVALAHGPRTLPLVMLNVPLMNFSVPTVWVLLKMTPVASKRSKKRVPQR
jgi:hypothetical protein